MDAKIKQRPHDEQSSVELLATVNRGLREELKATEELVESLKREREHLLSERRELTLKLGKAEGQLRSVEVKPADAELQEAMGHLARAERTLANFEALGGSMSEASDHLSKLAGHRAFHRLAVQRVLLAWGSR